MTKQMIQHPYMNWIEFNPTQFELPAGNLDDTGWREVLKHFSNHTLLL